MRALVRLVRSQTSKMQLIQKSTVQGLATQQRATRPVPRLLLSPCTRSLTFQPSSSVVASIKPTYAPMRQMTMMAAAMTDGGVDLSESTSIFVSNLAWGTDNDSLGQYISAEIDGLLRVSVMMRDGRSRGMAIAEFDSPQAAQSAVQKLHETDLDGRTINVRIAEPRPPRTDRAPRGDRYGGGEDRYGGERRERSFERREPREPREPRDPDTLLYVGNLSWGTSWQDVKDTFQDAGLSVAFADVKRTPDGKSRGFAIVAMQDPAAAEKAVEELDQRELDGRRMNVRRFSAEPREPRE